MAMRHGGRFEPAVSGGNKGSPVYHRIHEREYVRHGIEHAKPELADIASGLVRRREESKNVCPELVTMALLGVDLDRFRRDEMHRSPQLFRIHPRQYNKDLGISKQRSH